MGISKITLSSFRNHSKKEFVFSDGLTVVWGENGSGKTSLLEAIHLLSFGKSFKTHKQETLIKKGEVSFLLKGTFSSTTRKKDQINIQYQKPMAQKILINGKKTKGRKGLIGRNPIVVLSPEEQEITKGGPGQRRQFFDKVFSVGNLGYLTELQKYGRILKQRNAALSKTKKGFGRTNDVTSWNEPLAITGVGIWRERARLLKKFKESLAGVSENYGDGIDINISYSDKEKETQQYLEKLKKTEQKDFILGRTTIGPHRDDIIILWEGENLRQVGSQGEHKISLVFLKLAEMNFIKSQTGDFPTLLLDDLFAKLDLNRSKKLVDLLKHMKTEKKKPVQTIVTTTDILSIEKIGIFSGYKDTTTYHLVRPCST